MSGWGDTWTVCWHLARKRLWFLTFFLSPAVLRYEYWKIWKSKTRTLGLKSMMSSCSNIPQRLLQDRNDPIRTHHRQDLCRSVLQEALGKNKQLQGAFFCSHISRTWLMFLGWRAIFLVPCQWQAVLFSKAKLQPWVLQATRGKLLLLLLFLFQGEKSWALNFFKGAQFGYQFIFFLLFHLQTITTRNVISFTGRGLSIHLLAQSENCLSK